ncbi:hypothetical protein [Streptomyces sp. TP-A0874]|uniref:hypothetical protein n=1 Tax=Streptomyces sp. TP-A0874 TaxID=549819 RepID=UPI000853E249|nr:hypothetical protein [Streptomyces sp. TP-A0874]
MHKRTRIGLTAGVAAAVLLLGGCGSSDDDSDGGKASESSAPGNGDDGKGPGDGAKSEISGVWSAETNDEPLLLYVTADDKAMLLGKHYCTGKVTDAAGLGLDLECSNADTKRSSGTLEPSADGKTMKASWSSGVSDSFTKSADDTEIPTEIPTKLPENLPEELQDGLPLP